MVGFFVQIGRTRTPAFDPSGYQAASYAGKLVPSISPIGYVPTKITHDRSYLRLAAWFSSHSVTKSWLERNRLLFHVVVSLWSRWHRPAVTCI